MKRIYCTYSEMLSAFRENKSVKGGCEYDGIEYEFSSSEKMFNSSMGGYSCYAHIVGMTGMGSVSRIENVIHDAKKYWYYEV